MTVKIQFYPVDENAHLFAEPPQPASKTNVPDWFKQTPKHQFGHKEFDVLDGRHNLTVRSCLPLFEGFTSGYTMTLHRDIVVKYDEENNIHQIHWIEQGGRSPSPVTNRPEYEITSEHKLLPPIEGYNPMQFNWMPFWSVKTPPGYSCLFTHPMNRTDLPFYTLGGVIDTDKWGDAGNHPFMLKQGWSGVIEKGTPMFQFIPFKRNNWESEVLWDEVYEYRKKLMLRDSVVRNWYKRFGWSSKHYR